MSDTPSSRSPQQQEAARFQSALSESLLQSMQGNINYLLGAVLPVGTLVESMLTEAQFQGETSTGWVLADGRSCAGSAYAILTGNSNVPDARGIFRRGKNNGRSTASGDSTGEISLGTYQADQFAAHTHSEHYRIPDTGAGGSAGGGDTNRSLVDVSENTGSSGTGTETRPRALVINVFFRIN